MPIAKDCAWSARDIISPVPRLQQRASPRQQIVVPEEHIGHVTGVVLQNRSVQVNDQFVQDVATAAYDVPIKMRPSVLHPRDVNLIPCQMMVQK